MVLLFVVLSAVDLKNLDFIREKFCFAAFMAVKIRSDPTDHGTVVQKTCEEEKE